MLIQFSMGNFLSFRDQSELSMVASSIKERRDENTFEVSDLCLLKSAVVYGKNASGKSNLLQGMGFMDYFIMSSVREMDDEIRPREFSNYFKLNDENQNLPSSFEIVILVNGIKYRYGFELGRSEVINEWLFKAEKKKEYELFVRTETIKFEIGKEFSEGNGLESKTRRDALFITVCSQFDGVISKSIRSWFRSFNTINGLYNNRISTIRGIQKDSSLIQKVSSLLSNLDTDIEKIEIEKVEVDEKRFNHFPSEIPEEVKRQILENEAIKVVTFHKKFNDEKQVAYVKFDLEKNESSGTKKIFNLAGPILDTLSNGKVLVVDEPDSGLHPKITRFLVELFNSKETNPKNAQLVFATHDVTLLDKSLMRRDQMWFVEKDRYGGSNLFSLDEFKIDDEKVRNDASYSKDYMAGRYTAVPRISKDVAEIIGK